MAELKDLLDERRKMVDKKATQHREIRDDWNEKTKQFTGTRNELNNEVRERSFKFASNATYETR